MRILVVNAGSSSLKLSVLDDADTSLASETVDAPVGRIDDGALRAAISANAPLDAVGHRIVHGGTEFTQPVLVDARVRRRLEALTDLAPLHQPKSLRGLDLVSRLLPDTPAVACFDTAFHATHLPGGVHLRAAAGMAPSLGPPAVRLPRPLPRLRVATGRRAAQAATWGRCGSSPATWAPAPPWPR